MKQWILSVAGVAVLSVLCEIILPSGQTKKYVKTVIGVVVTLALVQPLFGFFGAFRQDDYTFEGDISTQEQYLTYVENTQAQGAQNLQKALQGAGFSNAEVVFDAKQLRYEANLRENFSQQRLQTAQNAARLAKVGYKVEFCWNNTE